LIGEVSLERERILFQNIEQYILEGQLGHHESELMTLIELQDLPSGVKVNQENLINRVITRLRGRRNSLLTRFYRHIDNTSFKFSEKKEELVYFKNKLNFVNKVHNPLELQLPSFANLQNDQWYIFQNQLFDLLKEIEKWHDESRIKEILRDLVIADYVSSNLDIPYKFAIECLYQKHVPEDLYSYPILNNFFPNINVQILSEDGHQDMGAFNILYWMYENSERLKDKITEVKFRNEGIPQSPKIFSFWATGLSDAPKIVQDLKIINEARAKSHGLDYVFLDAKSIEQYLESPTPVKKYRDNGNISPTFYSEWVRFALVNRYGGMWMDATIYLTEDGVNHVKDELENFDTPRFVSWQLNPSGYLSSMSAYSFVSNRNLITTYVQAGLELLMEDFEIFPAYYTVDNLYTNLHAVFPEVRAITFQEDWDGKFDLNYQPNIENLVSLDGKRKTAEKMWSAAWVLKFTYKNNDKLRDTDFGFAVLDHLRREADDFRAIGEEGKKILFQDGVHEEYSYQINEKAINFIDAKSELQNSVHAVIRRFAKSKDLSYYPLNWLSSIREWSATSIPMEQAPENDTVSVVITTYNRLENLKTAIASFLNTQHSKFEFVIVDDGSTDGTLEFLSELVSTSDVSFKTILNNQNGYRENKYQGVLASTGKYLIVFDDDDFCINDTYIDRAIRRMKKSGAGVVLHKPILYNFDDKKFILPKTNRSGIYTTKELIGHQHTFFEVTQSHIYDGECFRSNIPDELTRLDDEQITLIGLMSGKAVFFDDYSIVYRRSSGQTSDVMGWENHYRLNSEDFSVILNSMVGKNLITSQQYYAFFASFVEGKMGSELGRGVAVSYLSRYFEVQPKIPTPRFYILGVPEYGNIGDQAISLAMKDFIEKYSKYEAIEIRFSESLSKVSEILRTWLPGDAVAHPGGGNIGSLWPLEESGREKILSNFGDKPIIIFPQSIFFEEEKVSELEEAEHFYNSLSDLQLFTRENQSYQFAIEHFSKVTNHLVPDIVFSLPYHSKNEERQGLITLLRGDKEKSVSVSEQQHMISNLKRRFKLVTESDTVVDHQITHPSQREYEINKLLDAIASHEVVVTDRMHGMIFAYVTKTPAVVFDNSYHKTKGTYDLWLKDCPWIKMVDSVEQVDDAITEVISHKDELFEVNQNYFQPLIDTLNQTQ
jgi:pyruvyl transferase EpsI